MSNISKLTDALRVLNEHKEDESTVFREKLEEVRNVDLLDMAMQGEHVTELVKDLTEEEKVELDKEMESITQSYESILDSVADYLEDPEARKKIMEELKRRMA
jgi:MinD-like ATPase involved in chromosome partitioning or flagellar assembly